MRFSVFFSLPLVLFSALVLAHENERSAQTCAASVLGEATIPSWQFAALVVLFIAGALLACFGLVGRKQFAVAGFSFSGLHVAAVGSLLVLVSAGVYASGPEFNFKTVFFEKNQHVHADLKVYLFGKAINFSEERFQNSNEQSLSGFIHFENGNGNAVHMHASGVPLSYLFGTFGGVLNQTCLQVASSEPLYCSGDANSLRFYVNSNLTAKPDAYQLKDSDRLLLTFGPANEDVTVLVQSVTSESCILSDKCPVPQGYDLHEESCAS